VQFESAFVEPHAAPAELGGIRRGRPYYKHGAPLELLRHGDADFVLLAHYSCLSAINPQPSTIQKLREYKTVYVLNDAEIGLFSDEVVVNCAP